MQEKTGNNERIRNNGIFKAACKLMRTGNGSGGSLGVKCIHFIVMTGVPQISFLVIRVVRRLGNSNH